MGDKGTKLLVYNWSNNKNCTAFSSSVETKRDWLNVIGKIDFSDFTTSNKCSMLYFFSIQKCPLPWNSWLSDLNFFKLYMQTSFYPFDHKLVFCVFQIKQEVCKLILFFFARLQRVFSSRATLNTSAKISVNPLNCWTAHQSQVMC